MRQCGRAAERQCGAGARQEAERRRERSKGEDGGKRGRAASGAGESQESRRRVEDEAVSPAAMSRRRRAGNSPSAAARGMEARRPGAGMADGAMMPDNAPGVAEKRRGLAGTGVELLPHIFPAHSRALPPGGSGKRGGRGFKTVVAKIFFGRGCTRLYLAVSMKFCQLTALAFYASMGSGIKDLQAKSRMVTSYRGCPTA